MISPRASAASSSASDDVARVIRARTRFDATSTRLPGEAVTEHVGVERTDDVLPGDPVGPLGLERAANAVDPHEVALAARRRHGAGRRRPRTHDSKRSPSSRSSSRVASNAGSGSAATVAHPA